jgi:hypothetical protein
MIARKKILFIPELFYLSNPPFISLSKHLKEYETIYLECVYSNRKFSKDYHNDISKLHSLFSNIIVIEDIECKIADSYSDIVGMIKYYLRKRDINIKIIDTIKEIKPDIIILPVEDTYVSRFIMYYFPGIVVLVVQQSSLLTNPREQASSIGLRAKIIHSLKDMFFKYPNFSKNPWKKRPIDNGNPLRAYWSKFWSFCNSNDVNNNTIFYTGNAAIDDDINYGSVRIQEISNYNLSCPRLVYATQPLPVNKGLINKFNNFILECLNKKKNTKIIIKVHPRDEINYYIDFFKKLDHSDITIIKDGDISVLFKETDLLITGWSMTSYQALAMGVPVISINPDNIFDYSQSFTKNGIPVVNRIEQFIQKYDHFTSINGLNDFAKERIEFLKEINTFPDGKSAVRLANLIRDILNGNIVY